MCRIQRIGQFGTAHDDGVVFSTSPRDKQRCSPERAEDRHGTLTGTSSNLRLSAFERRVPPRGPALILRSETTWAAGTAGRSRRVASPAGPRPCATSPSASGTPPTTPLARTDHPRCLRLRGPRLRPQNPPTGRGCRPRHPRPREQRQPLPHSRLPRHRGLKLLEVGELEARVEAIEAATASRLQSLPGGRR